MAKIQGTVIKWVEEYVERYGKLSQVAEKKHKRAGTTGAILSKKRLEDEVADISVALIFVVNALDLDMSAIERLARKVLGKSKKQKG